MVPRCLCKFKHQEFLAFLQVCPSGAQIHSLTRRLFLVFSNVFLLSLMLLIIPKLWPDYGSIWPYSSSWFFWKHPFSFDLASMIVASGAKSDSHNNLTGRADHVHQRVLPRSPPRAQPGERSQKHGCLEMLLFRGCGSGMQFIRACTVRHQDRQGQSILHTGKRSFSFCISAAWL